MSVQDLGGSSFLSDRHFFLLLKLHQTVTLLAILITQRYTRYYERRRAEKLTPAFVYAHHLAA